MREADLMAARSRTGPAHEMSAAAYRTVGLERGVQATVTEAAAAAGWLCFHDFDSRRNVAGFPDLVCVRDGRLVFLELKTEKGRVRPEQEIWLEMLAEVPGVVARVVRPADLDEIIEEVLR